MERFLEKSRYLVLLAVASSLIAAAAAFLWGVYKTGWVLIEMVRTAGKDPETTISLVALMDKFLIAAGLYIFAMGMYELFIGDLQMPAWLTVHSLHDIKVRLSAIIILVMAIVFLEHLVEWRDGPGILFSGVAIAVVGAVLIAFNSLGAHD